MANNVYKRSFSYPMHMIQNACNLRYKDAYTSCYKCHAKCRKCTKKSYTYATNRLLEERQNGLDTTGKRELPHTQLRKSNTHQVPPANVDNPDAPPRASQKLIAAATLLWAMPAPSTPEARDLHREVQVLIEQAAVQQAESSASRIR
jgi:hypothetical protein